jgi:hypothetical protein
MLCSNCDGYFPSAAIGEDSVMTYPLSRRTENNKTHPIQREHTSPPAEPQQRSLAFESNGLHGLSTAERTKVRMTLAHLLLLAAGVVEETGHER